MLAYEKKIINPKTHTAIIQWKHKYSNLCSSLFLPHYNKNESLTFCIFLFYLSYLWNGKTAHIELTLVSEMIVLCGFRNWLDNLMKH